MVDACPIPFKKAVRVISSFNVFVIEGYEPTNLYRGKDRIYQPKLSQFMARPGDFILYLPTGLFLGRRDNIEDIYECYPIKTHKEEPSFSDFEEEVIKVEDEFLPCNKLDLDHPVEIDELGELIFHVE